MKGQKTNHLIPPIVIVLAPPGKTESESNVTLTEEQKLKIWEIIQENVKNEKKQATKQPQRNIHTPYARNDHKFVPEILSRLTKSQVIDKIITTKDLYDLKDKLISLNEELGEDESPIMTKIPCNTFTNIESLYEIFTIYYQNKPRSLTTKKERDALLLKIRHGLEEKDFIQHKKIYIDSSTFNDESKIPELEKIVTHRSHASLVNNISDATHIIQEDPAHLEESQISEDYCRTLEIRDNKAFIHWYYQPDSSDEWIPKDEVRGPVTEEEKDRGARPWVLHARFLRDSDLYNEWMNEMDYDLETISENDDEHDEDGEEDDDNEEDEAYEEEEKENPKRKYKKRNRSPIQPIDISNKKLPLILGRTSKLISLGTIDPAREAFHTERYIYPVGFKTEREFDSYITKGERATYICEITDGGDRPMFKVTPNDDPECSIICDTSTQVR
jgi:hypothetical protein